MNGRPLVLRTLIVFVVVLVFAWAIHPLVQRDYYETFLGMVSATSRAEAEQLIADAEALQKADPQLFQSQALLQAADAKGVDLASRIHDRSGEIKTNRDVMSLIRKNASSSIRLGLDLNGGVEFILKLVPDEALLAKMREESGGRDDADLQARMKSEFDRYRDIAIEILRTRLEGQQIFEAEIAPSGSNYVALRAPVVAKDEKAKLLNLIKMSAKLAFRLVREDNNALVQAYLAAPDKKAFPIPPDCELMTTSDFRPGQEPLIRYYFVEKRAKMDGRGISQAMATKNEFGQREIQLRFNTQGAQDFGRVTGENVGRELAIVLDGQLYCAPRVNQAITGGSAVITGQFSEEEAKGIADALSSGSFPFQIEVDAVFDTDPKLGASNVRNGIWVGVISMILVALFMIVYYRLIGVISVVALALNVVLILGAMAAFSCTLTLPGIAGIVLTIGMAVDANVLVFERIREELATGKSLVNAVDLGYSRAFSAVLDANLTTLITSIILMYIGTGAIKGFAVTLSIGILTSLFTALFVTRLIFDYLFRYTKLNSIHMMHFFRNTSFNFEKLWRSMFLTSMTLIVLSLLLGVVKGREMLGVDFTGGTVVTYNYEEQIAQDKLERALKADGYDATVTYKFNTAAQEEGKKLEVLIRGDLMENTNSSFQSPKDSLAAQLNRQFPTLKLSGGLESTVGGLIGWEFTKAATIAIILSLIGIGIYVSLRYEFVYAMSSILALMHDVIIVMGIFLALGRTVSLTVVAALLTVIGYSMNDKVVVFDRIRENVGLKVCKNYSDTVNLSINQTLNRTILTSLTTFIVVFVLFLGGGVAINDFVLVMMLGIIVGTYSSIFIAAPLVSSWHRRKERQQALPAAGQAASRK